MNKFIGVKMVRAESEDRDVAGVKVIYKDGYTSWCPETVFQENNLPVVGTDNKVHIEDVKAMIARVTSETIKTEEGQLITLVIATLANGFTITESSACVDPANYDEQIGVDICMKKIEDKVWFLLGFLMQSAVYGFNKVEKTS